MVPGLRFVTSEAASLGSAIIPLPETRLQLPVPIVGTTAPRLALSAQTSWFAPAFEGVGAAMRVIATVSAEIQIPPLVIFHSKRLVPIAIPLTLLVGEEGLATVPLPEMGVQAPVPTAGIFASSAVFSKQMV